jgi:hypothetical protein
MGENPMIKPPVFLCEGLDVLAYDSIEAAERHIEPASITGDETIYDSEGRLLHVEAVSKKRVSIQSLEPKPEHNNELRKALVSYLLHTGESEALLAHASLEDLVTKMMKYRV